MRHSFFIATFILSFAAFAPVGAQSLDASSLNNDFGVDFMESFDHIDNPYLADAIKLNYQITLLEKMTARQAELVKIKVAFDALGIPFEEPAPSYTLCTQLPPNTPCLRHYPQLYTELIRSRERHYAELMAQRAVETGVMLDISNMDMSKLSEIDPAILERSRKEEAARKKREEEERLAILAEERRNRYQWSEVTCLDKRCSGVVTGDYGFRATVREGTRLPDNTLVSSVSRTGIDVVIDGEKIALRPLPADATGISPSRGMVLDISERINADVSEYAPPKDMPGRTTTILNAAGTRDAYDVVDGGTTQVNGANGGASVSETMSMQANISGAGGTMSAGRSENAAGEAAGGGATVVEPALGPSGLF